MHDAYDLSQLVKLTTPIESIASFDDNLFVGTRNGHLLIYSVTKKLGEVKHDVQLVSYNKQFSKKPVQQLDVIPNYQVLVSLSDNLVSFHNVYKVSGSTALNSKALPNTKGASYFTIDVQNNKSMTGEPYTFARLCVVVKRKLQLYYWNKGTFHDLQNEITLTSVPRSVLFCMQSIVLGFKSEYSIYDTSQHKMIKLFPIGSAPEPILAKIDDNASSLGKDTQSYLINSEGATTSKHRISWSDHPSSIIFDKPFLIGVLPDAIEIRSIEPNMFIQKLACPKGTFTTRARSGTVYVANDVSVWCLQAVSLHHQIKSLLQDQQFELALRLATDCEHDHSDDQKKTVHEIQTRYAYHLFATKQYQESMSQFLMLDTKPYDVIKLYPDLLPASSQKSPQPKVTDREFEEGLSALIHYLLEVKKKASANLLSIVDTTLLKCYVQLNDVEIAPLLTQNMVHFQEAEQVLKKHNKLSELVILYQTNKLHSQALALLKQTHNIKGTVEYLQKLGSNHLTLLLDHAEWVFQEDPSEGLKIFTEDTTEVEQLPRPQILNFLLRNQKELAIPYLETAIKLWNDTNPILHTTLANLYRGKYQTLLQEPQFEQEAMKLRGKFIGFLEKSEFYTTHIVLDLFPKKGMLEERAIILGKQGRHEQALSIYVCFLDDIERAKKYCEKVTASQTPGYEEVYILLIRILVSPLENWLVDVDETPVTRPPNLSAAMDILNSYSGRIDPAQALAVLPDFVSIRDIRAFLENSIRLKLSTRRETQILERLVYSEYLQVQDQRMRREARPIVITDLHICVICSKRFTNQSIFALIPAGVVHYGCLKENA